MTERCPDCGAEGNNCQAHFELMLFWELDHQLWDKHHLMVLAYHLQHPGLYSPQTLQDARQMLVDFLENGVSPEAMRQKISKLADSGNRQHKITGTPDSHGYYEHPVQWSMTCADVVQAGIEAYYASVDQWALSVLQDL